MTISLSGDVLNYQGTRAGDYHESAIVNGLPSWINGDHAIWYSDGFSDWAVGNIEWRGEDFAGIRSKEFDCPYNIASSNWQYWNSGWVTFSSSVMSVTCSQAKGKNN
jgi:hypothetical protein